MSFEDDKPNEYSPEEKEKIMSDLWRVGPQKPLGYHSLDTITQCGYSIEETKQKLEDAGLKVLLFREGECPIISGALYVYEEGALEKLLKANIRVLELFYWPSDPKSFVRRVATKGFVPDGTQLFELIGKAFADKRFPKPTTDQ